MAKIVETQDLEDLTLHLANKLAQEVGGHEAVIRDEFLKLFSALKAHIGSRISDAQTEILEAYRNPLTEQLQGDSRQLQVDLYNSLSNF